MANATVMYKYTRRNGQEVLSAEKSKIYPCERVLKYTASEGKTFTKDGTTFTDILYGSMDGYTEVDAPAPIEEPEENSEATE